MNTNNFSLGLCVLIFAANICANNGARILALFPYPLKSHFTYNNAIVRSLIGAGHEVVMITSDPQQAAKENYSKILDVSETLPTNVRRLSIKEMRSFGVMKVYDKFQQIQMNICDELLKMKKLQDLLNSKENSFDVMFVEIQHHYWCYAGWAVKLNIPIIGTVPLRTWYYADQQIVNPFNPSYVPFEFEKSPNLVNFPNRVSNSWNILRWNYFLYTRIHAANTKFYEENFQDQMSWKQFMGIRPALIFYNSHSSYFPRPFNPNGIQIGGIQMDKLETLPQDLQNFLDEADNGAILFSFGSIAAENSMSQEIKKSFIEAFSEIPQKVIWKYDGVIDYRPDNIMLLKWLPQLSILAHKNTKAFISHCGQGSFHEAIFNAVPVVAIPLNFDQFSNGGILEKLQVAVPLEYETITKERVLEALNEIINNTKFSENMRKLSNSFKDRPMTPQETVVYWTEYVIRHKGASHLQSAAVELYWFQYYLLDVILFMILSSIIFLYSCYKVLKTVLAFLKLFIGNKTKTD